MHMDKLKVIIIISCGIFLAVMVYMAMDNFHVSEYVVTVTEKEKVTESRFWVYAEDESGNHLVFENDNSLLRWKSNSYDIWARLEEGKTYKIKTAGYRTPFFNSYPNIIQVEEKEALE